jgi:hypothetical protein
VSYTLFRAWIDEGGEIRRIEKQSDNKS